MDSIDSLPRVGLGWDRHRLQAGRPCKLGGVFVDSPVGPVGHSDADALLHAVTDALLGAGGLDDLGTLFPNTDPQWRDADSTAFLRAAKHRIQQQGLRVASLDCVIVCDQPKIGPHRFEIRQNLARLLELPADRVNVKGKTTEGDSILKIDVTAVVLLVRDS